MDRQGPLTTAANEDWATPNYDQSGGPFNLDTHCSNSRQACGRGLRATQQNTINLMCMPVCFRKHGPPAANQCTSGASRDVSMSKVGPTHCHQRSAAQRASRHALSPTKPTRCSSRTRAAVVGPHYNLQCPPQYCTTTLYYDHRMTFKNTDNAHGEYNGAGRARSMYTIWLHAAVL